MTDRAALVAAICAEPGEDTPRLAYADWLEENGEGDRAEFVRVQVEKAKIPPRPHGDPAVPFTYICERCGEVMDKRRREAIYSCTGCGEPDHIRKGRLHDSKYPTLDALERRERELFDPDLGYRLRDEHPWMRHTILPSTYHGRVDRCCLYTRGFVSHVTCTAEDWLAYADAITSRNPIQLVTLTDMDGWDARIAQLDSHADDGTFGCIRWPLIRFKMLQAIEHSASAGV